MPSQVRQARRGSSALVISVDLVAYLAMYRATVTSVISPCVPRAAAVMGSARSLLAPAEACTRRAPRESGAETEARRAPCSIACFSSSSDAHAGGAEAGPSGPSMRTTAWKCTTPRAWYSATLANWTAA